VLEVDDIQGLVLSGYGRQPSAAYLFLSVKDAAAAKRWLGDLAGRITHGGVHDRNRQTSLNVALTRRGVAAFGLHDSTLATFARPFVEGMAQSDRARLLGDAPETWTWGTTGHRIDVLLVLFGRDRAALTAHLDRERTALGGALEELFAIDSEDLPGSLEHFQFLDGISQPSIAGYREDKQGKSGPGNAIKAGEFVLGYENEYGQQTSSPTVQAPDADPGATLVGGDLGRNGTYLVVRQLRQDVAGFWNGIKGVCRQAGTPADPAREEALAAKVVGRWRDGTPLATSPAHDGGDVAANNDFDFSHTDPQGDRCPFGSHIRRANPRDTLLSDPDTSITTVKRHRLLRRGRPYGPPIADRYADDGRTRGLVFVTLNANIERQFEFVQHAWISSPNFAGLYDEADPLLGGRTETPGVLSMPASPIRDRQHGILPHVTVEGGEYFFLPSIRALRYLGGA